MLGSMGGEFGGVYQQFKSSRLRAEKNLKGKDIKSDLHYVSSSSDEGD